MDAYHSRDTRIRVAVETFGCRTNQYDSDAMMHGLPEEKFLPAAPADSPDVILVNTCTVTHEADRQARQRLRRLRRDHPNARIVVTGCYAEVSHADVAALPEVDRVVRMRDRETLASVLSAVTPAHPQSSRARHSPNAFHRAGTTPVGRTRATLKVQEGCNHACAFCIIPRARGRSRSIPVAQILDDVRTLSAHAVREVVLTGIHLADYGKDFSPEVSLAELARAILELDVIDRIRLSSLDPNEVTPELIALFADYPALCPHIHLAVQSGDDDVLLAMRREHTTHDFASLIDNLLVRRPDIAVGLDVIAAFPGESRSAHERTMRLIEAYPIAYLHVFPYSPRRGTTAAKLPDHLPVEVRKERARELRTLGDAKRKAFAESRLGSRVRVLFEDTYGDMARGKSREYISVRAPRSEQNIGVERTVIPVRWTGAYLEASAR